MGNMLVKVILCSTKAKKKLGLKEEMMMLQKVTTKNETQSEIPTQNGRTRVCHTLLAQQVGL